MPLVPAHRPKQTNHQEMFKGKRGYSQKHQNTMATLNFFPNFDDDKFKLTSNLGKQYFFILRFLVICSFIEEKIVIFLCNFLFDYCTIRFYRSKIIIDYIYRFTCPFLSMNKRLFFLWPKNLQKAAFDRVKNDRWMQRGSSECIDCPTRYLYAKAGIPPITRWWLQMIRNPKHLICCN